VTVARPVPDERDVPEIFVDVTFDHGVLHIAVVNGTDSSQGVRLTWTVADSGRTKWVSQAVRFRTKTGVKTVNTVAVVPCVY
jgi:hypothetical protein